MKFGSLRRDLRPLGRATRQQPKHIVARDPSIGSQNSLSRHRGAGNPGDALFDRRAVGLSVDQNHAAPQRVALGEQADLERGAAARRRETAQIEKYRVGNVEQLANRLLPHTIRAKRFVDAIARVGIGRPIKLGEAALQGRSIDDEYLTEAPAQK